MSGMPWLQVDNGPGIPFRHRVRLPVHVRGRRQHAVGRLYRARRGGPVAIGRGDPTVVVGSRHRPHHVRPAGTLGWVTVVVYALLRGRPLTQRRAVWYPKTRATFADALALVCVTLWTGEPPLSRSQPPPDRQKLPSLDPERLW